MDNGSLPTPGVGRLLGPVFSYKLRYIVGVGLVEMAILTNPKPTIYHNLLENTARGPLSDQHGFGRRGIPSDLVFDQYIIIQARYEGLQCLHMDR